MINLVTIKSILYLINMKAQKGELPGGFTIFDALFVCVLIIVYRGIKMKLKTKLKAKLSTLNKIYMVTAHDTYCCIFV